MSIPSSRMRAASAVSFNPGVGIQRSIRFFIRLVRYVEYLVWTYVLLRSLNLVIV